MGTQIKPYQIEGFYYIAGKPYIAASDNISVFTVPWLINASVIKATRIDVINEGTDFTVDYTTGKVTLLHNPLQTYESIFFIYTYPA